MGAWRLCKPVRPLFWKRGGHQRLTSHVLVKLQIEPTTILLSTRADEALEAELDPELIRGSLDTDGRYDFMFAFNLSDQSRS